MKIKVKVNPNSKIEKIERKDELFLVYVKQPAKDNKANESLILLLSKYFKVPKTKITILHGKKSKIKIVSIEN
jgi:uncharacterized protein (TIGR00251 family)